mmetsp:Transcript_10183/g.24730  ORF Transcript_10183/g.24730 Transcript_10183/m.24730 type:complete len:132 (+) Transcript_10183:186-581(+)|eukprot:CAMPEP_0197184142 /NCGR_PEP_ID=MMETSP1423-20130617/9290_1 /TAXON_ID=476441 /ORGANISM="Pseudo-nitzschia heimii, Strain UNC1101" /LENGTH=131 /DNA_ID=CAMNT_0042634887 /DNA_START=153 /DNA_END=548 /DNA_ORIENTATION=+
MSSSNPDEPATTDGGLTDDELSKRFYYGGLFGLPWLWIVHAFHFHGKRRHIEAQRMLRDEQQMADESSPEVDADNEIAEKESMWVRRARDSAVVVSAAWVTWVVFVQLIFPDALPSSWYIRDANSFEATGW